MTDSATDVIQALAEDVAARVAEVTEIVGSICIYSPDQLSTNQQRIQLPAVLYLYTGMRQISKHHDVFFDLYFIANAESLTQVKGHTAKPTATEILQKLRKGMACNTSATSRGWELVAELPDFGFDDKLVYRQRWSTSYQIIR